MLPNARKTNMKIVTSLGIEPVTIHSARAIVSKNFIKFHSASVKGFSKIVFNHGFQTGPNELTLYNIDNK